MFLILKVRYSQRWRERKELFLVTSQTRAFFTKQWEVQTQIREIFSFQIVINAIKSEGSERLSGQPQAGCILLWKAGQHSNSCGVIANTHLLSTLTTVCLRTGEEAHCIRQQAFQLSSSEDTFVILWSYSWWSKRVTIVIHTWTPDSAQDGD